MSRVRRLRAGSEPPVSRSLGTGRFAPWGALPMALRWLRRIEEGECTVCRMIPAGLENSEAKASTSSQSRAWLRLLRYGAVGSRSHAASQ